jgi:lipopolysaccharide export system protein LptA
MRVVRQALCRGLLRAAPIVAVCLPSVAHAQAYQHDSSLPIEITANLLEVEQRDRIATFTGDVDAVQGELVLSADKLRVFYNSNDQAGEAAPGATGSIRRIEAEGNVFITSPQETAQGESGVYDVAGDLLTLEGSVVLTRDDNVIRGHQLEIDLASGVSRVIAATPSTEGGGPTDRVRALFTPQDAAAASRGEVRPGAGPQPEPGAGPPTE